MSSFYPRTTIYACSTGIDNYNKYYFTSNSAAASFCMGRAVTSWSSYSYQRADERQYCAVDANIDDLKGVDTLVWQNSDFGSFYWIANVTQLEFKNPNTVWVWFEIDPFMTYCGNITWSTSYCYVEREHVSNDWSGSTPNFSNIGVPESIGIEPSRTRSTAWYPFSFNLPYIVIISPYDSSGEPNFSGTFIGNVFTGLNAYVAGTATDANAYLQAIADSDEADINNVVAILTIPRDIYNQQTSTVSAPDGPWTLYSDIYNAKCFSGQFCQIKLSSLVGESKYYNPELFTSPSSITFTQAGIFSGGVGGVLVEPLNYTTDLSYSEAFTILDYPSGVCAGNAYAQWTALNGSYTVRNAILSSISQLGNSVAQVSGNVLTGNIVGAVGSGVSGLSSIGQTANDAVQQFAEAKMYGVAMIGDTNTNANLAAAGNKYGYSINWITPRDVDLYALDDFFSRFGYQVNRLKVPNRNTRAHWNYVKCGEAHITGDMPYSYRVAIENMLNAGVTFWNSGTTIGDYSDKAGNRG